MASTAKTILLTLFYIAWIIVSAWLALMIGPLSGPVLFVALLFTGTLILVAGLRKLQREVK